MQKEVTILLPVYTHDGVSQQSIVDMLVNRICAISGGVSMWLQSGIELWEDGSRYIDTSERVVTVVDSVAKVNALRNIALQAIDLLHQRGGIFFQVTDTSVEFLSHEDIAIANRGLVKVA